MKKKLTLVALCVFGRLQGLPDAFILDHLVPDELKQILDDHTEEFGEIIKSCSKRKHCPARRGVKEYDWLPGYFVKYGVERVKWAQKLRDLIAQHGFTHLVIPKKYLYHVPGKPTDLRSPNYVVVAQKLERDRTDSGKVITKQMVQELMVLIFETQMKDHHSNNLFVTADGLLAMIDTGKESFYPYWVWRTKEPYNDADIYNSIALLIDKRGKFLKKAMITKEAYWSVVQMLATLVAQKEDDSWFKQQVQEHIEYVSKLKYRPWDYEEPFRFYGLIK